MTMAEELEALRISESIKGENLRELARLVLAYEKVRDLYHETGYTSLGVDTDNAEDAMINFAKGIEQ